MDGYKRIPTSLISAEFKRTTENEGMGGVWKGFLQRVTSKRLGAWRAGVGVRNKRGKTFEYLQSAHLVCDIWTSRCRVFFVLLHNCFVSVTV